MTRYRQYARRAAGIATIVALGWLGLLLSNSLDWVGQTFPCLFHFRNRVVASITLPDWPNA